MTSNQSRFLRLHQTSLVERTQAIFQGAMIRATSDRGEHATVTIDELEALLVSGAIARSHGGTFVATHGGVT